MKQPRGLWVAVGYGLLTVAWSVLLIATRTPDRLMLPFIIPVVGAALFYDRRVYLPMLLLLAVAYLVVANQLSPDLSASIETIISQTLSVLAVAELVHALVVTRRQAETALRHSEERLRHRNRQLMALGVIAESTSRSLDTQAILRDSANAVLAAFRLPAAWTFLVRDRHLETSCQQGLAAKLDARYPLGATCYDMETLKTGQAHLVLDVRDCPTREQQILTASGLLCYAAVPLPDGKGEVLGVLCAGSDVPTYFDLDTLRSLMNAGRQIGLALHRAKLYAETASRLADVRALAQASVHLTAELELGAILPAIGNQALTVLGADRVSVCLFDGTTGTVSHGYTRGLSDEHQGATRDFIDDVIDQGRPHGEAIWIEDVCGAGAAGPFVQLARREGFQTAVLLPLRLRSETSGVLGLYFDTSRPRDEALLDLAQTFANQAAVAVNNAQLFGQLRAAEAQYRGLFESNSDPIVVVNLDGTILAVNPAARRLTGAKESNLVGKPVTAYTPILRTVLGAEAWYGPNRKSRGLSNGRFPRATDRLRQGIRRVMAGETRHLEIRVPVDGETQTFELRVEQVEYAGRPALQWTGHDVTAQRDLAHWREDLTGIIVHNLRNPLAWIYSGIGLAKMILPQDTDPDAILGLDKAMEGVTRIEQQVEVLLNINRAEAGREVSDQAPLDPVALASDVIKLMRPRAESQYVELCATLPKTLPFVKGNYYVLAWAVENLIDNAIKFSPAGTRVIVQAENMGEKISIAVKDQGPGIDPGDQKRIFEKFYQAGGSEPKLGVGLGLYFVRLAASAHGGTVTVDSRPGQGSTFTIWLPTVEAKDRLPS